MFIILGLSYQKMAAPIPWIALTSDVHSVEWANIYDIKQKIAVHYKKNQPTCFFNNLSCFICINIDDTSLQI